MRVLIFMEGCPDKRDRWELYEDLFLREAEKSNKGWEDGLRKSHRINNQNDRQEYKMKTGYEDISEEKLVDQERVGTSYY